MLWGIVIMFIHSFLYQLCEGQMNINGQNIKVGKILKWSKFSLDFVVNSFMNFTWNISKDILTISSISSRTKNLASELIFQILYFLWTGRCQSSFNYMSMVDNINNYICKEFCHFSFMSQVLFFNILQFTCILGIFPTVISAFLVNS